MIPDLIIASLLWLVIIALLPPVAGFVLTVGCLIFATVLAAGLAEDLTVRVLYRARRATPAEAPRLAVAWRIATHQLDAHGLRLLIVSHGTPVGMAGRRHVLLRKDVVASCTNQMAAHQIAAMIPQGIGRLRYGLTRFDLPWAAWTIPLGPHPRRRPRHRTPPCRDPAGPVGLAHPRGRRHHRRGPRDPSRTLAVGDLHRRVHRAELRAASLTLDLGPATRRSRRPVRGGDRHAGPRPVSSRS